MNIGLRCSGLLLGLLALGACDGAGSASETGPAPLRVGVEAKYPPFESTTPDGSLEGFDIDLARAVGRELGREVRFENMAFDALIPELQAGRIDMICSAVSRNPERAQVVDFSRPYAKVPMGILVSKTRGPFLRTPEDLNVENVHIAVQRGTSGQQKARERFPKATHLAFDTEVDAASEVASGRVHAFVYDMVSVAKFAKLYEAQTRVLEADLGEELYSIVLPKGSPLLPKVDAFLAAAAAPGGELEKIAAKWLPDPERFRVRAD